jgi:hypothetical protein
MYRLLETPNSLWKKLLMMYYQVEASEEFLNCADVQLTDHFEKLTGLKVVFPMRIYWDNGEPFEYEKGDVSRISGVYISLKNGRCKAQIAWKSRSGRVYETADKDIDCNDLEFWIEGLDAKLANHYWRPKWSLVTFSEYFIGQHLRKLNIHLSKDFIACMDQQLSVEFTRLTGVTITKNIGFSTEEYQFEHYQAEVSSFVTRLIVNEYPIKTTIKWKSNSGRIYKIDDTDIDCNDIQFWFENLDIPLIHSHAYARGTLPFKLKDLSYELKVGNFSINCQFDLILKKDDVGSAEGYMENIDEFINSYNEKSEKLDRKNGVVHNWTRDLNDNVLTYELDLGSTGADFMKKLLKHLSEMNCFEMVNIA